MSDSTRNFHDLFSRQSGHYARYRPRYPRDFLAWLADLAPGHGLAWDVGAGSGQCAAGLAEFFDRVVASDASAQQISLSPPHPRVRYRVALAEESGLEQGSTDLVTVGQALHWFNLQRFYPEVRRVLRPGGLFAAWCYHLARVTPAVDALLEEMDFVILKEHWMPNAEHVMAGLRTLPFPFAEFEPDRSFTATAEWTLADVFGYIETFSATQRYRAATGHDPADHVRDRLVAAWGDPARVRRAEWTLLVRAGR